MAGKKGRSGRKMGKPLSPRVQQEITDKIESVKIVNALQNHALGDSKMTATQIRAAEILLNKTVSNLASIDHSGSPDLLNALEGLFAALRNNSRGLPS